MTTTRDTLRKLAEDYLNSSVDEIYDYSKLCKFREAAKPAAVLELLGEIALLEHDVERWKATAGAEAEAFESENASLLTAQQTIERLEGELAETWVDADGLSWSRPTAYAYAAVCKARDKWQTERDSAQQSAAEAMERVRVLEEAVKPFVDKSSWGLGNNHSSPTYVSCSVITPSDDGGKTRGSFALATEDFYNARFALTLPLPSQGKEGRWSGECPIGI